MRPLVLLSFITLALALTGNAAPFAQLPDHDGVNARDVLPLSRASPGLIQTSSHVKRESAQSSHTPESVGNPTGSPTTGHTPRPTPFEEIELQDIRPNQSSQRQEVHEPPHPPPAGNHGPGGPGSTPHHESGIGGRPNGPRLYRPAGLQNAIPSGHGGPNGGMVVGLSAEERHQLVTAHHKLRKWKTVAGAGIGAAAAYFAFDIYHRKVLDHENNTTSDTDGANATDVTDPISTNTTDSANSTSEASPSKRSFRFDRRGIDEWE